MGVDVVLFLPANSGGDLRAFLLISADFTVFIKVGFAFFFLANLSGLKIRLFILGCPALFGALLGGQYFNDVLGEVILSVVILKSQDSTECDGYCFRQCNVILHCGIQLI
jgi:hypothetical protein